LSSQERQAGDKNKYAIIQYLMDIAEGPNFKQISWLTTSISTELSRAGSAGILTASWRDCTHPAGSGWVSEGGRRINYENKIVLAIAIRLAAERFMVTKINDPAFVAGLDSNQTPRLLNKFRELFSAELTTMNVLRRVALVTPREHLFELVYVRTNPWYVRRASQEALRRVKALFGGSNSHRELRGGARCVKALPHQQLGVFIGISALGVSTQSMR
jgi:hypothetical protein